jgi:tetratricopeptide (TPR) repeat protein
MKCTNCKTLLPQSAKFCPQCGYKVEPPDELPDGTNPKPLAKPIRAFSLIIAAVAIAMLIVILVLESNKPDTQSKEKISTNTVDNSEEIQSQLEKLQQNPESVTLNIEMGNLLFDSDRYGEAVPYYQKSLSIDPKNISVQIDLAICYFNLQNLDRALVEMKKALDIDPNHPLGLFNMGIIYYNLGDNDKAREYWQRLIAINPELTEAKKAQELIKSLN